MAWRETLGTYLRERLPSADDVEIASIRGMPAGVSNETLALEIAIRCDGHAFSLAVVLRPQREQGLLAPYDVGRQFRTMRLLQRTAVPVPAVFWYEPDPAVLGAPFFLMEWVRGQTLPLFWYGGRSPELVACAHALATIHAVDWRAAGLDFLDEAGETAIGSDLAQWRRRAEARGVLPSPLAIALGDYLERNEPAGARRVLLHGDPNPGNYILDGARVAAVVDWELAAIGDPRSDLGFYAALRTVFGGWSGEQGQTLLSTAYEEVMGARLHDLAYYEVVGLYKILMAGWWGRGGVTLGHYGQDAIGARLEVLLGPRWAG